MSNHEEVMNTLKRVPGVGDHLSSHRVTSGKQIMQRRMIMQMTRGELADRVSKEFGFVNFTSSTLQGMELGQEGIPAKLYSDVRYVLGLTDRQL